MGPVEQKQPDPEDVRLEYSTTHDFHIQAILIRFTVIGLYLAAFGLLAQSALESEATTMSRVLISTAGIILGICMWIVELRTRTLYTAAARRLIELERRHWYKQSDQIYEGSVSSRYKFPPEQTQDDSNRFPPKPGPERPKIAWMKEPLPSNISWHLTHSMVFDILYPATFLFWIVVLFWDLIA